jgi:hypothetical protein
LQHRIERMRLHPAIVAPGAAAVVTRTAVRHGQSSRLCIPARPDMGTGGVLASLSDY